MAIVSKVATWIAFGVLALFGLMLLLGLFVPIYTDEVGSKSQLSRVLIEGGRTISLLPQCRQTWVLPLPTTDYPAAFVYHVLFSRVGLFGLRVSGVVLALGAFSATAFAIRRTTSDRAAWVRQLASFVSLFAFGVVPLTLTTARSEPLLIVALGLYAAFPLVWSFETRRTVFAKIAVAVVFVVLTSIFYFSHPKALLFTPFVLLSAVFTFPWKRPAALSIVVAFVLFASFQTFSRAKEITSCPESPHIDGLMRFLSSGEPQQDKGPRAFIVNGLGHLEKHSAMSADLMSNEPERPAWLPRTSTDKPSASIKRVDSMIRVAIYALFILAPLYVFASAARFIRERRARRPLALAMALVACTFGHVFLTAYWSFYNVSLVIGALAIASAVTAWTTASLASARTRPHWLVVTGLVQLLAIVSMVATSAHVAPELFALARQPGTTVPGQPAQARIFGYGREREKIRAHAGRCGIRGDGAKRLVIDDTSLYAFDDLREPLHLIYVTDNSMWGGDLHGEKDIAFLASLGSPGIISRCAFFPTSLVDRAIRDGDYCCVGEADLR